VKKNTVLLLFSLLLATAASAETDAMKLSLKEAVRLSLERNLDLKAEFYNPAQAEADIRKNRSIYETHLTLDSSYRDSTLYSPALDRDYDQSTLIITPGVSQLLPTGGNLGLSYQNIKETNSTVAAPALGSFWNSSLGLTLNQPLLKNFGRDTTDLNIRVSEISKEISISHLKSRILAVVAQVRTEYFKLAGFREDLESRKISLELESRVKAGVLPAMEILNAQFGVASREKELIDAEKAVSDQIDVLTQLLQIDKITDIDTTDKPDRAAISINEADALKSAISFRPEMDELNSQLKSLELQSAVGRPYWNRQGLWPK